MKKFALAIAIGTAVAACASNPENPTLILAQSEIEKMRALNGIEEDAPAQFDLANKQLEKAQSLQNAGRDSELVSHHALLATKHAQIAQEKFHVTAINNEIASADSRRQGILLESSRSKAREAEAAAAAAELRAEQANKEVFMTSAKLAEAQREAERMEKELKELSSKQSDRGTVVTLKDIVFKTDSAEILQGAERELSRVADLLKSYPDRRVRIEGSTDSRGPAEYNQQLSQRRAEAVANILLRKGVSEDRITTIGLGEDYPVATNDTAAGQQKNRRVEIIIANSDNTAVPSLSQQTQE